MKYIDLTTDDFRWLYVQFISDCEWFEETILGFKKQGRIPRGYLEPWHFATRYWIE